MKKIKDPRVVEVFKGYSPRFRKKLLELRKLILEVSEGIDAIDELVETLKWGQPSYVPKKKNVGTAVRIHWLKSKPNQYGVYFNCNTKLIFRIRKKFGNQFNYEGTRALVFQEDDQIPVKALKECISMALTYHRDKKKT